ncbi:site-specific integrase [Flavobacterium supellecticarium]|uniref:Site-specific integrase n=1 Tax=Flavobacterium supellecticarium TaxID=2565924 RepID=A0A4S4A3F4_9FLAO|nr:site-specific integrase [Flavobacterium supellecticarium]THF52960.1 site-specific integrase [Flavobacterium supellecticarium]
MEKTKRSTFKVLFYLKKNAPKKDGTVPVMCRVTVNGKQSAFSAKLDISPSNWDLKFGRISGKSKQAQCLNAELDSIRLNLEQCHAKLLKESSMLTSEKLKNAYLGLSEGEMTFFKFFDQYNADFKKKVANGIRNAHTLHKYEILLRHLRSFARKKYGCSDLGFNDISCDLVQEFDYYLRNERSLQQNSVWLYMIAFTTVCRLAISRKYLIFNPFSEYKNTKEDKDRGYLLRNELEEIIGYKCVKRRHILIKDLFLFSCFTGLSYSDIKRLEYSHIQEFFDGNKWIIIRRKKTTTSSNVMLLPMPKMIIEKYTGLSRNGKLFPVPCNKTCNHFLKALSEGIPCLRGKKITFHLARHTFGTLFLSEGVPLESLSKMMGHKNIATTQIYAKVLNEKVGKDMQQVAHRFETMERAFVPTL